MKTLFLTWQNPLSRTWFPVGRLTFDGELYRFGYIQGALTAQQQGSFKPVWAFPDLFHIYESSELFPLFANRLMRKSRPDYSAFLERLNIPEGETDPITLLSRSGGQRVTDNFEVFPYPQPDENGLYHIHFFVHGLRYMPPETQAYIQQLRAGIQLYIMQDSQNPFDPKSLLLRTEDAYNVGYCPRYLTNDVLTLLRQDSRKLTVMVERVNPHPTPVQFRLLCNLSAEWSADFEPFSDRAYQPLAPEEAVRAIAS